MPLVWRASLRHLLRHPWQTGLCVVGIALGVAVVLAIDRRPSGPRAMVLFLPGFYLLVPGASGLIDVTESVAPTFSTGSLLNTMLIVVAIALGVLVAKGGEEAVIGVIESRRSRRSEAR